MQWIVFQNQLVTCFERGLLTHVMKKKRLKIFLRKTARHSISHVAEQEECSLIELHDEPFNMTTSCSNTAKKNVTSVDVTWPTKAFSRILNCLRWVWTKPHFGHLPCFFHLAAFSAGVITCSPRSKSRGNIPGWSPAGCLGVLAAIIILGSSGAGAGAGASRDVSSWCIILVCWDSIIYCFRLSLSMW